MNSHWFASLFSTTYEWVSKISLKTEVRITWLCDVPHNFYMIRVHKDNLLNMVYCKVVGCTVEVEAVVCQTGQSQLWIMWAVINVCCGGGRGSMGGVAMITRLVMTMIVQDTSKAFFNTKAFRKTTLSMEVWVIFSSCCCKRFSHKNWKNVLLWFSVFFFFYLYLTTHEPHGHDLDFLLFYYLLTITSGHSANCNWSSFNSPKTMLTVMSHMAPLRDMW